MYNETEKLTINLSVVELAQIDVLVELGTYSNRSDFIRTAIKKDLAANSVTIERNLIPVASKKKWHTVVGILAFKKSYLEEFAAENTKVNLSVVGMLIFDKNIPAELFEKTMARIVLRGKLIASDEIKEIIRNMN